MRNLFPVIFCLSILIFATGTTHVSLPSGPANDSIADLFRNPARESGIRCWWWWLNGNVTKQSITRDLEAMKAKGFSGASIIDAGGSSVRGNKAVPLGPAFGTPEWQKLYLFAVQEAKRLGLELGLMIQSGWNLGGPDVKVEESNKHLTWSEVKVTGPGTIKQALPQPPSKEGFYRDIAVLAFPAAKGDVHAPIRHLGLKAAFHEAGASAPDMRHLLTDIPATPGEGDALVEQVQNLTAKSKNGELEWAVPPGDWLIMRFGYTTSNARLKRSSRERKDGTEGFMIDFMSRKHFNRYWDTNVEPLLNLIGPMAGTTLKNVQTDSWEGGGINWTEEFREEFRNRRGYDLLPYLPVVAGKIIESRDVSNRFLADLRKTVGDCIAENHYGTFAERARRHGMGILPESAGPHAGPFDGLKNYGHSEIMMGEFWAPSPHRPTPPKRFFVKQAASAAHIYNKRLIAAEAFTTGHKHWNDVIWIDMKSSFDHEVCAGLNLVYLHTFTSSPKEMGLPGQEYYAGTHINPNITWWDMSGAFFTYMARSQYLMQQGQFVADVLYYYGDHVPNIAGRKAADPAKVLPGFDYDIINEDMLQTLVGKKGRVTLPHGLSYRILVLPDHKVLSLAAARQVQALVKAGATVIGPRPETTSSLVSYPQSEMTLKAIADELWGTTESASGSRKVGEGRVIWGQAAREVLLADDIQPDFIAKSSDPNLSFDYIHHTLPEMDYYFVSSQNNEPAKANCTFRIEGKQPELWDPVTGEIREAKAFKQVNGQTTIPLEFNPHGSVFVVFRKAIPVAKNGTAPGNYPIYSSLATLKGPWELKFDAKWGGPASVQFNTLESWTDREEEGIRHYSGKVVYSKEFDSPVVSNGQVMYLDLGDVQDVGIARIHLNGKDLGIVWTPPFRVKVTDVLKKKNNKLEVEVINSWRNRLVGDRDKPEDQRFTKTNITILKEWQLLPSGLLGPVQLLAAKEVK